MNKNKKVYCRVSKNAALETKNNTVRPIRGEKT